MRAAIAAVSVFLICAGALTAWAQVPHPPLEAYGELPQVRNMALSPDGNLIAFLTRADGADFVTTFDVRTSKLDFHVRLDNVSTRNLWFADNEFLVILASDTTLLHGFQDKFEYSAAFSFSTKTNELAPLLRKTKDLYPAQAGLGHVLGHAAGEAAVFMPAYIGKVGVEPTYDLLKVNLASGRAISFKKGSQSTIDWFVDADGKVLAREDYSNARNHYEIQTYITGKKKTIFKADGNRPPFSLMGVKADRSSLILAGSGADEDTPDNLLEMDFEGNIKPAGLSKPDTDIAATYSTDNRLVAGVRYDGPRPSYKFFEPGADAAVQEVVDGFPNSSVYVLSHSSDWSKILYLVEGGTTAGQFILQDRTAGKLMGIISARDTIPAEAIGEVNAISYPARDGLNIPAIVTWPAGSTIETRDNLPLVVMPHGGPAAHDTVGFDWMAQYFANRGYAVLQPNFRGSTGYGYDFMRAGAGEWGAKMQDDVTDGVEALVREGLVDPDRVCIVGASYGGYSALAGGAYSPDLYKCVVAIAPVSDLPRMIRGEASQHGRDHWAVDYWKDIIGNPKTEKDKLSRISPVNSASQFKAPVLLIHGRDDTVVPFEQSDVMRAALTSAGKSVELVALKNEDHWLSEGDTRKQALEAMSAFVDRHIGSE